MLSSQKPVSSTENFQTYFKPDASFWARGTDVERNTLQHGCLSLSVLEA